MMIIGLSIYVSNVDINRHLGVPCAFFQLHQKFCIRCKLLYIVWINNKILLYNTGNYIQYPVINLMEKNMKYVYIYIYESLYSRN